MNDTDKKNEKDSAVENKNPAQNSGTKDQSGKQENKFADKVSDAVQGDTKAAKEVYNQAKEATSDVAVKFYDAAAKKTTSKIEEQKTNFALDLSDVADSIRQIVSNLSGEKQPQGVAKLASNYTNTLADKVGQVSDYVGNKDLGEMMKDAEDLAHRNPALFLGGAFALGVVAARFLKSTNSNQAFKRRPRYERKGEYLPDEHEGVHLPEDLEKQVQDNTSATTKSANAASPNKGA